MSLKTTLANEATQRFLAKASWSTEVNQIQAISSVTTIAWNHNSVRCKGVFFENELQEIQWESTAYGIEGKIKYKR